MTKPATTIYNGIEHPYAPNPRLSGDDWKREFPPIQTDAEYLRNKFTGDIVPNTPDFAQRSDILEPYYGDVEPAQVKSVLDEL